MTSWIFLENGYNRFMTTFHKAHSLCGVALTDLKTNL